MYTSGYAGAQNYSLSLLIQYTNKIKSSIQYGEHGEHEGREWTKF